jgi:hypothetical protein
MQAGSGTSGPVIESPVGNVDNRPTTIEPRQSDAVENAHLSPVPPRGHGTALDAPPLLRLAGVRALEDADVAPENRSRPGPPPCQAPAIEGA